MRSVLKHRMSVAMLKQQHEHVLVPLQLIGVKGQQLRSRDTDILVLAMQWGWQQAL